MSQKMKNIGDYKQINRLENNSDFSKIAKILEDYKKQLGGYLKTLRLKINYDI